MQRELEKKDLRNESSCTSGCCFKRRRKEDGYRTAGFRRAEVLTAVFSDVCTHLGMRAEEEYRCSGCGKAENDGQHHRCDPGAWLPSQTLRLFRFCVATDDHWDTALTFHGSESVPLVRSSSVSFF